SQPSKPGATSGVHVGVAAHARPHGLAAQPGPPRAGGQARDVRPTPCPARRRALGARVPYRCRAAWLENPAAGRRQALRTGALVALILSAFPLAAQETILDLDPAHTEIHFSLGDVLHKVQGTFQLKRGTLRFDPATGKAGGEIVIDVTSGDTGNAGRDRRMHK